MNPNNPSDNNSLPGFPSAPAPAQPGPTVSPQTWPEPTPSQPVPTSPLPPSGLNNDYFASGAGLTPPAASPPDLGQPQSPFLSPMSGQMPTPPMAGVSPIPTQPEPTSSSPALTWTPPPSPTPPPAADFPAAPSPFVSAPPAAPFPSSPPAPQPPLDQPTQTWPQQNSQPQPTQPQPDQTWAAMQPQTSYEPQVAQPLQMPGNNQGGIPPWASSYEAGSSYAPLPQGESQPADTSAPADLSSLLDNNPAPTQPMADPAPISPESVQPQPAPATVDVTPQPVVEAAHSGFPKWLLIGGGVVILLAVIGGLAYFILNSNNKTISLPAEQQTPAPATGGAPGTSLATPPPAPQQPTSTFGNLQGSTSSAGSLQASPSATPAGGSSAIKLLEQRRSGSTPTQ